MQISIRSSVQCRTDSILEFRKFLYFMKCFYSGRQCTFEITDSDKGGQKLLLANYFDPFPVTISAASMNVNSKSQVETNEGSGGSGSFPICSSLRCRSRPYDWQIHPPCSATQQIHHKYTNCVIQIHWLWCTNPELWGTNLGKWIRLMKTPTTKHM